MILRGLSSKINSALQHTPAVVLLGPRQVGKTTLALNQINKTGKEVLYIDLELPSDALKLQDAEFFLSKHQDKLIIIDEVQRLPELFPLLRSLIDQNRIPGRFVLLGSASEALIGMSAESLAGRVSYMELHPLSIAEIPKGEWDKLWIRGGYPPAYLASEDEQAIEWTGHFVRTYIERELGMSGLRASSMELAMFLRVVSSIHGQLTNYSELSKVLQLSTSTVKKYLNFFEHAYILRMLNPYHINIQKRLVKSPKVIIRDSGILHYLRGIPSLMDLEGDILKGASWEGFALQQILSMIKPSILPYFYRTASGTELDLILVKGNRPYIGFEFKYSNSPKLSRGTAEAMKDLNCEKIFVVTPTAGKFEVRKGVWIIQIADLPAILHEHDLAIR